MLGVIIAVIVVIFVLIIMVTGYKKAPPDTAYIISGLRKKVIIGCSEFCGRKRCH